MYYVCSSSDMNYNVSLIISNLKYIIQATALFQPLYRPACVTWRLQLKLDDFVGAKFYCPHARAVPANFRFDTAFQHYPAARELADENRSDD